MYHYIILLFVMFSNLSEVNVQTVFRIKQSELENPDGVKFHMLMNDDSIMEVDIKLSLLGYRNRTRLTQICKEANDNIIETIIQTTTENTNVDTPIVVKPAIIVPDESDKEPVVALSGAEVVNPYNFDLNTITLDEFKKTLNATSKTNETVDTDLFPSLPAFNLNIPNDVNNDTQVPYFPSNFENSSIFENKSILEPISKIEIPSLFERESSNMDKVNGNSLFESTTEINLSTAAATSTIEVTSTEKPYETTIATANVSSTLIDDEIIYKANSTLILQKLQEFLVNKEKQIGGVLDLQNGTLRRYFRFTPLGNSTEDTIYIDCEYLINASISRIDVICLEYLDEPDISALNKNLSLIPMRYDSVTHNFKSFALYDKGTLTQIEPSAMNKISSRFSEKTRSKYSNRKKFSSLAQKPNFRFRTTTKSPVVQTTTATTKSTTEMAQFQENLLHDSPKENSESNLDILTQNSSLSTFERMSEMQSIFENNQTNQTGQNSLQNIEHEISNELTTIKPTRKPRRKAKPHLIDTRLYKQTYHMN